MAKKTKKTGKTRKGVNTPNPNHLEDFEKLLKIAVTPTKPEKE